MSKNDRKTIELQRNEIIRLKTIEENYENIKVSDNIVAYISVSHIFLLTAHYDGLIIFASLFTHPSTTGWAF